MLYRYPVNAYVNQADEEAIIVKLSAKDPLKDMFRKTAEGQVDTAPNESGKQAVRDPERCLHVTSYPYLCSSKHAAVQLIWNSVLWI